MIRFQRFFSFIGICLFVLISFGCGEPAQEPTPPVNPGSNSPTSTGNPPTKPTTVNLTGLIQKGPFILGSQVNVYQLDVALHSTGIAFATQTNDDFGSFTLHNIPTANPVEAVADGFHFNEIYGRLSNAPIRLRALAEIGAHPQLNVNILTTLATNRIRNLVAQGSSFRDGKNQAETEVLANFRITRPDTVFEGMDISQDGEANAMLLAVSVIMLQNYNDEAEFMERIAHIARDIEDNGSIDDQGLNDEICESAKSLDLQKVRTNLENRYISLGLSDVQIPPFEDYVDSDCDGAINRDDAGDTFLWQRAAQQPWNNHSGFGMLAFNGRLWIMGGRGYNPQALNNEIWSSVDGQAWTQTQTSGAIWSPRRDFASFVFEGRMWVMGGIDGTNARADGTWSSADGISWRRVGNNWNNAAASVFGPIVFNNRIWLFAYESIRQATGTAYSSTDGVNWRTHPLNISLYADRFETPKMTVHDGRLWLLGLNDGTASGPIPVHDAAYSSADGITWRVESSHMSLGNMAQGRAYSYRHKLWFFGTIAIYESPTSRGRIHGIWSSEDGITWNEAGTLTPYYTTSYSEFFNDRFFLYEGDYERRLWFFTDYAHY